MTRLPFETVKKLDNLLGGDPVTEEAILMFIQRRWKATNLFEIPAHVAEEILLRPKDFISAALHAQMTPF